MYCKLKKTEGIILSDTLTLKHSKEKWDATSISSLDSHISFLIQENEYIKIKEIHPLKKNISYNLQYLQFLNRVIDDISMSNVIYVQNIKSFLVIGSSIIESIFYYLVVSSGNRKTVNFKSINKVKSQEYKIDSKVYNNEIEIFEKTTHQLNTQMTFDRLIKIVKSKKLLGEKFKRYAGIKKLRQLRNKIHIHGTEHYFDTDWNNFSNEEYELIKGILFEIFTSKPFKESKYLKKFNFLK